MSGLPILKRSWWLGYVKWNAIDCFMVCKETPLKNKMLSMMGKLFSRGHFEMVSFFFLETKFDISCKLSSVKKICMKCQILFPGKNKKTVIDVSSAELVQRVVKVELRYTNISSEMWLWSLLWMTQPANVHCAHLLYKHCPWRNHLSKSLADVWKRKCTTWLCI